MTVTYTAKVSTSSLGCFLKLLLRWRGSIYKLLWKEFLIFVAAYYLLNLSYRFAMKEDHRRIFERLATYCDSYGSLIPVSFVLGFYVSIVIDRWWGQFRHIPWPDRMSLFITAIIHGHDERGRLMRRTVMRYLSLSYVITMSSICMPVKKRFPTFSHMTEAGFMLPAEQLIIENIKTPHNKYFVPLVWSASLISRARKEGRIKDDHAVKTLIDELNNYRGLLGELFNYDCISVPLVYTQVVTLATYMFFLSCLMGRQFLQRPHVEEADMVIPVFTFLQFFFYMGWLKVAETLVNPFGEDDDDFDINRFIDRNLQVAYLVVDEMHEDHPELIKDQYWDDVEFELPYTAAAAEYRVSEPHLGSAMDVDFDDKEVEFIPLSSIQEEDHMEDIHREHLMEMGTTPTQIPKRQMSNVDTTSVKTTASGHGSRLRNLIQSFHRDSRKNLHKDSPTATSRKLCSKGSQTSGLDYVGQGSPTITSIHPDDIFSMSDISDMEIDDNRSKLLDNIASNEFLHMLRNRATDQDEKKTGKSWKDPKGKEKEKTQKSDKQKQTDHSKAGGEDTETALASAAAGRRLSSDIASNLNLEPISEGTPECSDTTGGSTSSKQSTLVQSDDSGTDGLPVRPELSKPTAGDIHLAVAALENLQFRKEKNRPDFPLRSLSVAGSDMTTELGLMDPSNEDELRIISTSQGPMSVQQRPASYSSATTYPERTPSMSSEPSTGSPLTSEPSMGSLLDKDTVVGDFAEISEDGMTWKRTPVTSRAKKKSKMSSKDKDSKRGSTEIDQPPVVRPSGHTRGSRTSTAQDIPRVIHSATARSRMGPDIANFEFSDEMPLVSGSASSYPRPRQGKSSLSKSLASPIKYPKPDI